MGVGWWVGLRKPIALFVAVNRAYRVDTHLFFFPKRFPKEEVEKAAMQNDTLSCSLSPFHLHFQENNNKKQTKQNKKNRREDMKKKPQPLTTSYTYFITYTNSLFHLKCWSRLALPRLFTEVCARLILRLVKRD